MVSVTHDFDDELKISVFFCHSKMCILHLILGFCSDGIFGTLFGNLKKSVNFIREIF